jgi:hypothetical protein
MISSLCFTILAFRRIINTSTLLLFFFFFTLYNSDAAVTLVGGLRFFLLARPGVVAFTRTLGWVGFFFTGSCHLSLALSHFVVIFFRTYLLRHVLISRYECYSFILLLHLVSPLNFLATRWVRHFVAIIKRL